MTIELIDEPTTELTVPARAQLALNSSKTRADLTELVKKSVNINEVKNAAGRAECHAAAMVLVKARTAIKDVGKAARDDATKFSAAVIAEEKALIAITEAEEKRLLALRDEWDAKIAVAKAAQEQAEREQAAKIQAHIDALKLDVALASATSIQIFQALTELSRTEVSLEVFGSRAGEAEQTRMSTVAQLGLLHTATLAREVQQAEMEQMRATLAAAQKQLEEDQAAAVAARMAEDLRLAGLRAEEDRRIAAERAKLDADLAAARKAEQDKADEAAAAERLRLDAIAFDERMERQRLENEASLARAVAVSKDLQVRYTAHDLLDLMKSILDCIRTGAVVAPDLITESIERVIEKATGEAA